MDFNLERLNKVGYSNLMLLLSNRDQAKLIALRHELRCVPKKYVYPILEQLIVIAEGTSSTEQFMANAVFPDFANILDLNEQGAVWRRLDSAPNGSIQHHLKSRMACNYYEVQKKKEAEKYRKDSERRAASSSYSSNNYNPQPAPKLSLAEQIAIERERRRKQAEWEAAWKSRFETAGKVIKWLFNKFLDLGKFIGSKLR